MAKWNAYEDIIISIGDLQIMGISSIKFVFKGLMESAGWRKIFIAKIIILINRR